MILHCAIADKFIQPFIDFVEENFDFDRHFFLVKISEKYPVKKRNNVCLINLDVPRLKRVFLYVRALSKAKKIIIHGLFDKNLVWLLALQPWLLKRCYWIMWGGDFYSILNKTKWTFTERVKANVIRRVGNLVTQVPGDYQLVREKFGASGTHWDSFVYPSNLYQNVESQNGDRVRETSQIKVLLGNSADPSNNHLWVLEKIKIFQNDRIIIYCPLSYGDEGYAKTVASKGRELFGDRFLPLFIHSPLPEYLQFLKKIDIAIFAHNRQQAMGNMTTLLGMGKKVYMRRDVTSCQMFMNIGVKVFDVEDIDMLPLSPDIACENILRIKEQFSEKNLRLQLERVFS